MKRVFALFCLCFLLLPHSAAARDVIAGPVTGTVLEVLDGDTLAAKVHIWIGQDIETHVRLNGIDTPEKHGKCASERSKAAEARAALEQLVSSGKVVLTAIRYEKYAGRVLATGTTQEGVDIASYLIEKGFARPYHGRKRASWCE